LCGAERRREVGTMEGAKERETEAVCWEILSVGPYFRELAYRGMEGDLRVPAFRKKDPLFSLHG
jgi:hypothetical protein